MVSALIISLYRQNINECIAVILLNFADNGNAPFLFANLKLLTFAMQIRGHFPFGVMFKMENSVIRVKNNGNSYFGKV